MRKVFIETYGCQMNVADTELMHGVLQEAGFGLADRVDDADVVLHSVFVLVGREPVGSRGADLQAPIPVDSSRTFTVDGKRRARLGMPRTALRRAIDAVDGKLRLVGYQPILLGKQVAFAVVGQTKDKRAAVVIVDGDGTVLGVRSRVRKEASCEPPACIDDWVDASWLTVVHGTGKRTSTASKNAPAMKRVESGKAVPETIRKAAAASKEPVLWLRGGSASPVLMERAEEDERGPSVLMERADEDERGVDLWVFTGANALHRAFDAIVNNGPSVLLGAPTTSVSALPDVEQVLRP